MKVLCMLGIRDAYALVERVITLMQSEITELLLVYTIDTDLREDLQFLPGGWGRQRKPRPRRTEELIAAEEHAAQMSLQRGAEAALTHGFTSDQLDKRVLTGRPDHEVVDLALQEHCDLVVLRASDEVVVRALVGPDSVGPTARFILDHAPCDVLLIRSDV